MRIHFLLGILLAASPLSAEPLSQSYGRLHASIAARKRLQKDLLNAIKGDKAAGWKVIKAISALKTAGYGVDFRDASGLTPLQLAILHDDQSAVESLLSAGANVFVRTPAQRRRGDEYYDCADCTTLDLAIQERSGEGVYKALLNFGATAFINRKSQGYPPLIRAFHLHLYLNGEPSTSGSRADGGAIWALVQNGADVNAKGPGGLTALHAAAINRDGGHRDFYSRLRDPRLRRMFPRERSTAPNIYLVAYLLDHGAKTNVVWRHGQSKETPAQVAHRRAEFSASHSYFKDETESFREIEKLLLGWK